MIAIGAGPQRSAFLSAFFTVVGCHGLHVTAGVVWLALTMAQVAIRGLRPTVERRKWKCGEQMRWAARSISLSRSVRTNHQVIAGLSKSRG
jgi:heme/copper-type cytochrome/quinol oxidase subunit 3